MELKAQISKITNEAKESEQAEVESGDNTGPMVTEADIANIVAQWTGTCHFSCAMFPAESCLWIFSQVMMSRSMPAHMSNHKKFACCRNRC